MGRGKSRIIVSELPYQTNKTTLVERIAGLVRAGKLEGLVDLRDESDRQNPVRLVIELKRGVDVTDVLVRLFKLTPLQSTFGIIMLALVDGQPRTLGLKQALRVFLDHRLEVIARRSQYDLARARERAHVLEGLIVALDNLDAVVRTIRKSRTTETARKNLVKSFAVTEIQAGAILEMPLRRLASLEIRRIRDEHREKRRLIKSLEELLASPVKQRALIAEELAAVKAEFGDRRRTIVSDGEASGVTQADFLMPEEKTVVMLSTKGDLGRTHGDDPPKITTGTKQPPRLLQHSTTAQILYLFASDGHCATLPVQQAPQVKQAAEGQRFSALTDLGQKRKIVSFLCLPTELQTGYICFFTAQGQVKRLHVLDLPGVMSHEFGVMKLAKRDRIVAVLYSTGLDELLLTTARGQVIRFSEDDVRPTGLSSGGVRGIELKNDRAVAACAVVGKATHFWHIDKRGHANLTELSRINAQARGGIGRRLGGSPGLESEYVAAAVGRLNDTCLVVTSRGKAKYMTLGLAAKVALGPRGIEPVIALRDRESVVGVVQYRPRIDMPADDELSLKEIETLLNQADSDDGEVSGSSNGAGPASRADD